jgi:hypothetical protein
MNMNHIGRPTIALLAIFCACVVLGIGANVGSERPGTAVAKSDPLNVRLPVRVTTERRSDLLAPILTANEAAARPVAVVPRTKPIRPAANHSKPGLAPVSLRPVVAEIEQLPGEPMQLLQNGPATRLGTVQSSNIGVRKQASSNVGSMGQMAGNRLDQAGKALGGGLGGLLR